ncbi:OmpA family protein [Paraflavitalea sp. CAU 1676]|uniref:OmpA family protein n=1 Tax=Paraflavitalea sp. CAU 1676 TaxID=3032598 RepID=UPI0023DA7FE4|nr:OmpA family protein [Paraflavitalea sp. CAU 1676]MDF2189922.1 OmpA family protein [Paraflavitalea sp. CAU 1676]
MKHLIIAIAVLTASSAEAQLLNKLKNLAKDKAENKVVKESGKAMDSVLDGKHGKKTTTSPAAGTPEKTGAVAAAPAAAGSLKVYSAYDFVPGDKVIAFEDFSQDARGDFPAKWNTNAGGEIVTLEGHSGQWLAINKSGVYMPEFISALPDNFTLEFEVGCNPGFRNQSSPLSFAIASLQKPDHYTRYMQGLGGRTGFNTWILPMSTDGQTGRMGYEASLNGDYSLQQQQATTQFHAKTKNFMKVAIWRQKTRIRIYFNEEKVVDVARALNAPAYNALVFGLTTARTEPDQYFITNLRLATGAPDLRNKLLTEGKFVTTGILFDVNSDRIKPESYGVLKEIAATLKENASLKVKITGHTDSDGEAAYNLNLSKQRAAAVKAALTTEFGIDADRMETDGKGESAPVDKATTPAAKANNRRVEFEKQ